jgi:hypothetical protein
MRQQELADARVQGETVDAVPGGVHQHRARTVHQITPGHDLAAILQHVAEEAGTRRGLAPEDREYRADRHVEVDVGRPSSGSNHT